MSLGRRAEESLGHREVARVGGWVFGEGGVVRSVGGGGGRGGVAVEILPNRPTHNPPHPHPLLQVTVGMAFECFVRVRVVQEMPATNSKNSKNSKGKSRHSGEIKWQHKNRSRATSTGSAGAGAEDEV